MLTTAGRSLHRIEDHWALPVPPHGPQCFGLEPRAPECFGDLDLRKSHRPIAVLMLCLAAPLAAQTPAKPDAAAEASAAMERAKRQAAGPMRFILEASKARRKPGEGDAAPVAAPAPAPSDAASLRTAASRSAATAPAANAATNPAANAPSSPPTVAAAAGAPLLSALVPAAATGTVATGAASPAAVSTQFTLEAGALAATPKASAVSGLESSPVVGPITAPLAVAPKAVIPQMQASDRVRLLTMVEPEVPQRVLDDLGRNATILVDLTLRADGSVASVDLASPAPRGLLRVLTPSLEQWKFAPLLAQRTHRIELLFNVER